MTDFAPLQALFSVLAVLDALDIPHAVGGSLASMSYGTIRQTFDADLVVDIKQGQAEPFVQAVQDAFYVDLPTVEQAIRQGQSFNLIHYQTTFKIDIFVAGNKPFNRQQIERRIDRAIYPDQEQATAWVCSPEDVVLAKLDWFRKGGESSERQWRDVLGVLKAQPQLDEAYMQEWASILRISDLLARALAELKMA